MLNKFLVTLAATMIGASAMATTFEKELGRKVTAQEQQHMQELLKTISAQDASVKLAASAAAVTQDSRTIPYNMACLTAKGGAVIKNVQKLVCANIYGEVFTIAKSSSISEGTNYSLSANVGVLYARMFVNESAYTRLQSFVMLEEPVDAIGVDAAYGLYAAQIVFLSSPNVSLKLIGWTPGVGGGLTVEQNGNVDRSTFEGSLLTIKKFNF